MNRFLLSIILIWLFIGCRQEPDRQKVFPPLPPLSLSTDTQEIIIHGMTGAYPETIKGKKLGEGLLNFEYKKIDKTIKNQLKALNKQIKITFKSNSKNKYNNLIINGMKNYFQSKSSYILQFDGLADVNIIVLNDNNLITFKILFNNRMIFKQTPPIFIKLAKPITWYIQQSTSKWSEVVIENIYGKKIKFKVLAKPVLISEYDSNILTKEPKAKTYISFDDADEYCYNKYKGSIVSLYVFEYALREGLIEPATKYGASKEFVAGFDPANEEDVMFRRVGDVVYVKSNKCEKLYGIQKENCYSEEDASNQLIFNYNSYKYERVDFSYKGQDVTFRCMIKEN